MSAVVTTSTSFEEPEAAPDRSAPPSPVRLMTARFFLMLVCYQSFHQLEHAIETVQLNILHHASAHTLINGVDFEYVHFGANALLLYGLFAVVIGAGARTRAWLRTEHRWGWSAMVVALVVQTYHVFDHTVRLIEYIQSGGKPPEGTLTVWLNPVWFHFGINLVVLIGMFCAFFGMGMHRSLRSPQRRPATVTAGSDRRA
jgi:hypothetical protein